MNYKLSEICNNIESYQNTNKLHDSFKQPIVFGAVCISFECCKCARMRFHWAAVLVVLSICTPQKEHRNIADDAMQMDIHTTLNLFYTTEKMPHVTVTITKKTLRWQQ